MSLSMTAKVVLGAGALVGVLVYLVLLDYGVNAGRVHYGVSVAGFDVGGFTEEEARVALRRRGRELKFSPVVFTREGFSCNFIPDELGWRPRPLETAESARLVGLQGGFTDALSDRIRSWFGGVDIEWAGEANYWKVTPLVDRCEREAGALGYELKRYRFRKKVLRSIVTWPRRNFGIPVAGGLS